MTKFKDFFNKITNDGRIFSYEDVIDIPLDEDEFYREALDYQYGKIGFPPSAVLDKSDEVSQIGHFIYEDGSEPRAHYRSKMGEKFIDPKKPFMTTPSMERKRVNMGVENTSVLKGGVEHNESLKYQWKTEDGACEECKSLDGTKYASQKDIPEQPHPNCKCKVEKMKNPSKEQNEQGVEKSTIGYWLTQRQLFKNMQNTFPEKPLLHKWDLSAREYYQISLTGGNSINTIDTANIKTTVGQLKDMKLRNHILNLPDANADNNTMVVIPKQGARIINQIKQSKEFKNVIKELLKANLIKLGNNSEVTRLDYVSKNPKISGIISADLALTIGHAHLYNTHFDEHGNLYTTLVDWYDFDEFQKKDFLNGINNNAYEQQERGDLTNYVLVIPIVLTKTEVDNL